MKKHCRKQIAFLLVFVMVFSLFGGVQREKRAQAASSTITLGKLSWSDGDARMTYTFPEATVQFASDQKLFSISVTNGGSFTVPEFTLGTAQEITGLKRADASGNKNEFVPEVKAGDELVQMTYFGTLDSSAVESFLRRLVFHRNDVSREVQQKITALANDVQLEADMGAMALDGVMHYYRYVKFDENDNTSTWYDAYRLAKESVFEATGLRGYLATITRDVEQEYIYKFFNDKNDASHNSDYLCAWIGGLRTTTTKIQASDWDQATVDPNKIYVGDKMGEGNQADTWYWMCGPEAGKSFYKTTEQGTKNPGGELSCDIPYAAWGNQEPNNTWTDDDVTKQEYALEYGYYAEGYWNDYSPYRVDRSQYSNGMKGYLIEYSPYENDAEHGGTKNEEKEPSISTERVITGLDGQDSDVPTEPSATPDVKKLINGVVEITNADKNGDGKDVVKVGTVLTADITKVNPYGAHDTLTYQWYVKKDDGTLEKLPGAVYPNYVVTDQTIDKELVAEVTGNGHYYGNIDSEPYDTKRTSVDIGVEDNPDKPDEKRSVTISPTDKDTIYAIGDDAGNILIVTTLDGDKNPRTPDAGDKYPGYFTGTEGGTITFTDLDKDKMYVIHEIKIKTENNEVISPSIPDEKIKTEYDDKGTADKEDDRTTIIIEPADPNIVYAVLEKRPDGSYQEVSITKTGDGSYKADEDGDAVWSAGGETTVKFTELKPGGTYKVVAKSKDGSVTDVTPGTVTGGSQDIQTPNEPGKQPDATPTPAPDAPAGTAPGTAQGTTQPTVYTKQEQDNAAKFVKEHLTDPKGKIVTSVTDLTRDLIVSGEADWKKLTDKEKQAVNERLKAAGCPYTYEQLLKMAKTYKIPGFKVIKFMKQKSKAKLKLIKCSGATIACSSTNSKVATISKKGVISAKKVGRATLTFTAIKGKNTNRLVIDLRVKKKFKNAKELTKLNSKAIKTPTALIAKKRVLKKSSRIDVYDLEKSSKVKFEPLNKKVLTINKKGKYTGKKKGNSLVRIRVDQNKKVYWLYVYVTIY